MIGITAYLNIKRTYLLVIFNNLYNKFNLVNIGNEKVIKLLDLIKKIEKITGKKFKNKFLPLQRGDTIGSRASSKKLRKSLNE